MKEMEQETKVETQEEDQKDDKQEEQTSAANLPKTQEELDALIEGRIKREHRKWSRQQAQQRINGSKSADRSFQERCAV